MKQIFVPVFPGTNCEQETFAWVRKNLAAEVCSEPTQVSLDRLAGVLVPGGFTFGDYLRAGALAAQSKQLNFIRGLPGRNIPILGICNGFQILCEAKLLPGALTKNTCKHHLHGPVSLRLNSALTPRSTSVWLPALSQEQLSSFFESAQFPISCGMGAYLLPQNLRQKTGITLGEAPRLTHRFAKSKIAAEQIQKINLQDAALSAQCQVGESGSQPFLPILHYVNNEPGSSAAIAGIVSADGLVLGMMPHPERAADAVLGDDTGNIFLLGLSRSQNIPILPGSPLANFAKRITGEAT